MDDHHLRSGGIATAMMITKPVLKSRGTPVAEGINPSGVAQGDHGLRAGLGAESSPRGKHK